MKNPFGDSPFADAPLLPPSRRIRAACTKLRGLRNQVGPDGFTPAAARALLDEVTAALEACAAALESSEDVDTQ